MFPCGFVTRGCRFWVVFLELTPVIFETWNHPSFLGQERPSTGVLLQRSKSLQPFIIDSRWFQLIPDRYQLSHIKPWECPKWNQAGMPQSRQSSIPPPAAPWGVKRRTPSTSAWSTRGHWPWAWWVARCPPAIASCCSSAAASAAWNQARLTSGGGFEMQKTDEHREISLWQLWLLNISEHIWWEWDSEGVGIFECFERFVTFRMFFTQDYFSETNLWIGWWDFFPEENLFVKISNRGPDMLRPRD